MPRAKKIVPIKILHPFSLGSKIYRVDEDLKDLDKDRIEDLKKRGLVE
ncbi:MAG: hypothetical protein K8E24_013045 [Methanobacterium paludis]|nr:hypothetical protein [Methanobacterium paludis]